MNSIRANDYIPHQLGLSKTQPRNLLMGKGITIPIHRMGAEAGEHIIMLNPANAKKLLNSYKKGKGIRIKLSPDEIRHTVQYGNGFAKAAKKFFKNPLVKEAGKKAVRYGAEALGAAVGSYFGNPEMGMMVGDAIGSASEQAIDRGSVKAGARHLQGTAMDKGREIAYDSIKQNINKLPSEMRPVARELLDDQFDYQPKKQQFVNYGYGLKKGSDEMREKMAMLRSMKKGGNVAKSLKNAFSKDRVVSGLKTAGKYVIPATTSALGNVLGGVGGTALGNYSGDQINKSLGLGVRGRGRPRKEGGDIGRALKKAFSKDKVISGLKTAGKYGIPAATSALGVALGSTLGGPMGGVGGAALGGYAGDQINKSIGLGMRRGRGRPKKVGGALASSSTAYQKALSRNFNGLTLSSSNVANEPVSKFKVNPRVQESSTEMTLSPYQRMDSPAMNPFIPTSYTQMGGTSAGYGGKGLYGSVGRGLYG